MPNDVCIPFGLSVESGVLGYCAAFACVATCMLYLLLW